MNINIVDKTSAYTTLRLWHELYISKNIAHDFQQMLSPPNDNDKYYGLIQHNQYRAIALCRSNEETIQSLAYAPEEKDSACCLLHMLFDVGIVFDIKSNKHQPLWILETQLMISGTKSKTT